MAGGIGWIIAAFLAGILLSERLRGGGQTLRRRARDMGVFAGRSYVEIRESLHRPQAVEPQADGRVLRTWRGGSYGISLLFDARDVCLGVYSEENLNNEEDWT